MAWEYIKCPHCKCANGPRSVNPNSAQQPLVHTRCEKCGKPFTWLAKYGRVQVFKS